MKSFDTLVTISWKMDSRDRFYGFSLPFNIFAEKKTYYAGIMLDTLSIVLCSKLCRHNVSDPRMGTAGIDWCIPRDQFTSEHCEWIYQESCYTKGAINRGYRLDKKHLQKRHCIFRRDREPSRIPARSHDVWATRAERLENLFLLFTNVSVWECRSKTLCEV